MTTTTLLWLHIQLDTHTNTQECVSHCHPPELHVHVHVLIQTENIYSNILVSEHTLIIQLDTEYLLHAYHMRSPARQHQPHTAPTHNIPESHKLSLPSSYKCLPTFLMPLNVISHAIHMKVVWLAAFVGRLFPLQAGYSLKRNSS